MAVKHAVTCQHCKSREVMNRQVLIASFTVRTSGRMSVATNQGELGGVFSGTSRIKLASDCAAWRAADVRAAAEEFVGAALRAAGWFGPHSIQFEGKTIELKVYGARTAKAEAEIASVGHQLLAGKLSLFDWRVVRHLFFGSVGLRMIQVREALSSFGALARGPASLQKALLSGTHKFTRRVAEIDDHLWVCLRCGKGTWVP